MRRRVTATALNAVCPYFTMFPLSFPLRILERRAQARDWVLDPFSGRGTTNYASRLLGLPSIGIDSSRVAAALTRAKVANASPDAIVDCARELLATEASREDPPQGEFWSLAFHPRVLRQLSRLRAALIDDCASPVRQALCAILLGTLHGPQTKRDPSYFSNQCPRTYAPKPAYAVKFWSSRGLRPQLVDVEAIIQRRAQHYYEGQPTATGIVLQADSRDPDSFVGLGKSVSWVITSPPYYGLRTYVPDQWLRNWFLGGPSTVDYSSINQIQHVSPQAFANQLASVWNNVASICSPGAKLIIRFGGITDRKAEPLLIVRESLHGTPWRIQTIRPAGSAAVGRRQSLHFGGSENVARREHDVWAQLIGA
jgi:hypothetical protein